MTGKEMPTAEVDITVDLVRRLLADQRPDLVTEPVTFLAHGWDNELFRIGRALVGRFPRRELAAGLVENEARWLPTFADSLPLPVPAPTFLGRPGDGFPWCWVLTPWIRGASAATVDDLDLGECARQLGRFLRALHQPAPPEAPVNPFRGVPLAQRDEVMQQRLESLRPVIDIDTATAIWGEALGAEPHRGPALWLHGDLHPHNLLAEGRRLTGVVDFGDVTAGDPATDLAIGWSMLGPPEREDFFEAYGGVDEARLSRTRGWALAFACAYLANSADNPIMHAIGEHAYSELMAEA